MLGIFRESFLMMIAQKAASIVTATLVMGMCLAVLLTAGKAEGSQQAVLSTIDASGTRSIVVQAGSDAGITSEIVGQISAIEGIEHVVALGAVQDVRNALLPDGTPIPLRDYWGDGLGMVRNNEAVASQTALLMLGMELPVGSVRNSSGVDTAVVGRIPDPSFLESFEPLLLTPRAATDVDVVGAVVIVVTEAALVTPITEVITPLVMGTEPGQVSISSSQQLALLRDSIDKQLGTLGSTLTLGSLILTATLVMVVQLALVLLKRRDWGRRRALGANRFTIIALIVTHTGMLAVIGATIGVIMSLLVLQIWGDPLPSVSYLGATMVLAIAVSVFGAIFPAVIASYRDPITELRVP